ncbi:MAG: hypothetical protein H6R26_3446, partial [Proteobacteria bacterium]|nr:hypothetical protein [Pseudomonadota bacterium]
AGTLSERFTHPRGPGSAPGLGLGDDQVDALADFLENGLYDPAFVRHDPISSTRTFQLNERDVTYSKYRPDLAALGAIDGRPASGLPQDNDDALSRRDMGLEFLNVTSKVRIERLDSRRSGWQQVDEYRFTNNGSSVVDTHLLIVARGLPDKIRLVNGSGLTRAGNPYRRVFLQNGVLLPGQSIVQRLRFKRPPHVPPLSYALTLLSGQGKP